jgi:hypothetical protein
MSKAELLLEKVKAANERYLTLIQTAEFNQKMGEKLLEKIEGQTIPFDEKEAAFTQIGTVLARMNMDDREMEKANLEYEAVRKEADEFLAKH